MQKRRQVRHQGPSSQTAESKTPTSRINAQFLVGLSVEDQEEFKKEWVTSKILRKRLIEVLTKEIDASIIKQEGEDFLRAPNLMDAYADQQGFRRGIRHTIKLLQQDTTNDH